jgi:hypothetical protein
MSYPFHEQIEELLEITIGEESSPSRPGGFPKAKKKKKINFIQNLRTHGLNLRHFPNSYTKFLNC